MLRVMGLDAIALLRLSASDIRDSVCYRVLADSVLVRLGVSFASEPEELALALHRSVGDALERHRDPRGVLVMPEVAAPKAASYDSVAREIGDGGTWVKIEEEEEAADDLLSMMMGAMAHPGMQDIVARARDMMMGKEGDLLEIARSEAAAIEASTMATNPQIEEEMREVIARAGLEGTDLDAGMPDLDALMNDPGFMNMVNTVRDQLFSDPAKLAELQTLLGSVITEREQDENEQKKPPR
jgi:hypothetical protein